MSVDYGAAYTKAVLVTPDGVSTLFSWDDDAGLSGAVHADSDKILVGPAAWQQADAHPDVFVASPLRMADGPVPAGGGEVEPAELVAATLRRVADEAAARAGAPVEDVRLVVPAGWGPRRRTWWRRAAGKAGWGQARLVEAPVAVAARLALGGFEAGVVRCWLVVDVGAGCEVSVLRQAGSGVEVLATMADTEAGGDRIDAALLEASVGAALEAQPAERRWALLASVRAAKHAMARQPAVTIPVPVGPAVVVNTALLRQVAQPVFERVGKLAAEVVVNADLGVEDLDGVYAVGGCLAVPGAAEMIAGGLGVTPEVPEQPGWAAALGAADAPPDTGATPRPQTSVPRFRRLVELGVPGVLSLLLFAHFVFSAEFNEGTPSLHDRYYYVLANWGELTVAATLAFLTCLQAASLIGAQLPGRLAAVEPIGGSGAMVSSGLGVAAAAGLAVASLYGITAAVYFARPVGGLLRWAVLPLLPLAVCAALTAAAAWRRDRPAGGWEGFLAFPLTSSVASGVGIFAVSMWWQGHLPAWLNGWQNLLGYGGGLLLGFALACTISRQLLLRGVLTVLLGLFCAIISRSGPDVLAVVYAITVAAWWAYRAWATIRSAPRRPAAAA